MNKLTITLAALLLTGCAGTKHKDASSVVKMSSSQIAGTDICFNSTVSIKKNETKTTVYPVDCGLLPTKDTIYRKLDTITIIEGEIVKKASLKEKRTGVAYDGFTGECLLVIDNLKYKKVIHCT
ncbi:hypothetical protein [Vibrio crassostreae]|uniref:hypothetical protein n=1 Tax=Vibrio crassostreae TaxID=246167 RepID=UPI001B30DC62|nr:hypothetical protein [Vibrio crassostreae]